MKRKAQFRFFNSLVYRCAPVSFYLEDLNHIFAIIEARDVRVKISDDEYEYESFHELMEKGGTKVQGLSLEVRSHSAYEVLTLEFGRGIILLKSDKSEHLIILWHELKDILSYRTRWYWQIFSWRYTYWITLLLVFATPRYFDSITFGLKTPDWILPFLTISVFLVAALSGIMSLWKTTVHLRSKREVANFFSRNIETLVAGAVGTVIGSVVTAIVSRLYL